MDKVRLFVSHDNGQLYERVDLDEEPNSRDFWIIEVPQAFGLVPSMLTVQDGSIAEMLLRTGIGKKVE